MIINAQNSGTNQRGFDLVPLYGFFRAWCSPGGSSYAASAGSARGLIGSGVVNGLHLLHIHAVSRAAEAFSAFCSVSLLAVSSATVLDEVSLCQSFWLFESVSCSSSSAISIVSIQ